MSEYLDVAIEAAKKGGDVLMRYYAGGYHVERKGDGSPVTEADKASEKVIIETIRKRFPEHAFLGEETGATGESEYVWVIDPLDGTLDFSHHLPDFSILIALFEGDHVIMGVSYAPALGLLMHAEKGRGAFVNGERAHVSQVSKMSNAYCFHGWFKGFVKADAVEQLSSFIKAVYSLDDMAPPLSYRYVIEGKADAYFEIASHIWDVAPYVIMVEEAGGTATDIHGGPITRESTSILIANPVLHQEIIRFFPR